MNDVVGVADIPVRDAATVVLLRDGARGLEAWLLTRVRAMAFAAGMTVFPGGRIEESDADVPVTGSVDGVASGFGVTVREAHALVAGAARETFEETGVLLTTASTGQSSAAGLSVDLLSARAEVEAGRVPFASLLADIGASVDADLLVPWARWVTPPGEARRYDTRFFLAELPSGARAADVTSESSGASWVPVHEALAEISRGERAALPPTAVTLDSLRGFGSAADALAAGVGRDLAAVRPTLSADGATVRLPSGERLRIGR